MELFWEEMFAEVKAMGPTRWQSARTNSLFGTRMPTVETPGLSTDGTRADRKMHLLWSSF